MRMEASTGIYRHSEASDAPENISGISCVYIHLSHASTYISLPCIYIHLRHLQDQIDRSRRGVSRVSITSPYHESLSRVCITSPLYLTHNRLVCVESAPSCICCRGMKGLWTSLFTSMSVLYLRKNRLVTCKGPTYWYVARRRCDVRRRVRRRVRGVTRDWLQDAGVMYDVSDVRRHVRRVTRDSSDL